MDELHQFSTAMLAVVFAAVMLVAGQLYIERASSREHTEVLKVKPFSTTGQPRSFAARFDELTAEMLRARQVH